MSSSVRIRYRGAPGARVEVRGDFPDWTHPVPLVEERPGEYVAELLLAPGVYRYKLVVDGAHWLVDPEAPAVERVEGVENGVLVVGGSAPPLFFAPDRRHAVVDEHGRFRLRCEVEAGAPLPARVVVEAHGRRVEAPLVPALARGDRLLLEACADLGAPGPARVSFDGVPGSWDVPIRTPAGAPPDWLAGATLYGIFLDRWHRHPSSPVDPRAGRRAQRSTPSVFMGGDLDGVAASVPWIAGLGIDAIVLTPVALSDTPHRYDAVALDVVDPRLGGPDALRRLGDAAHAAGLKLIVDASLTHVNERHAAFRDVLEKQESSPYRSWFRVKRFPVRRRDPSTYEHYWRCPELPWLALDEGSPARRHAIDAALALVDLGVDGLRLDAMNDAPPSFWRQLRAEARARRPDLLLLGEVVSDRPAHLAEEAGVDVATDFRDKDALLAWARDRSVTADELWSRLRFARLRVGAFDDAFRCAFLDNHDTARFLSLVEDPALLRAALAVLLFLPSTAWLTYGTELELSARAGDFDLDAAWPERIAMPALPADEGPTGAAVRALCGARRAMRDDGAGEARVVATRGRSFVVERTGRAAIWRLAVVDAQDPLDEATPDVDAVVRWEERGPRGSASVVERRK